jgi:hypothetical protein
MQSKTFAIVFIATGLAFSLHASPARAQTASMVVADSDSAETTMDAQDVAHPQTEEERLSKIKQRASWRPIYDSNGVFIGWDPGPRQQYQTTYSDPSAPPSPDATPQSPSAQGGGNPLTGLGQFNDYPAGVPAGGDSGYGYGYGYGYHNGSYGYGYGYSNTGAVNSQSQQSSNLNPPSASIQQTGKTGGSAAANTGGARATASGFSTVSARPSLNGHTSFGFQSGLGSKFHGITATVHSSGSGTHKEHR